MTYHGRARRRQIRGALDCVNSQSANSRLFFGELLPENGKNVTLSMGGGGSCAELQPPPHITYVTFSQEFDLVAMWQCVDWWNARAQVEIAASLILTAILTDSRS